MTAEIIPFPPRRAEPALPDPADRLTAALQGLEAALVAQRQAIAEWRAALGMLHGTVSCLGEGLQRYHGALGGLQARVTEVHNQATKLERRANSALAKG